MNTQIHSGNRRLALVSLYASLCSVLAVAMAVQLSQMSSALSANITQVSALPGYYGITRSDLRAPSPMAGKTGDRNAKILHNAARRIKAARINARDSK